MRIRATGIIAIAGAFFALASVTLTAFAHHANSAFDRTQLISVTGTVTKWQFINPHCGLWLDVTDEQGNVQSPPIHPELSTGDPKRDVGCHRGSLHR